MPKSDTPARDAVLAKYLNEAYGKEKQLETALVAQIALAKRPQLKKGLQDHLKVTKAQSRGLKKRIKELGGVASEGPDLPGPDAVSEAATTAANVANRALAAAKGPVQALRGTSEADNELRNVRDCYWNEAEEIAHYAVIETVADQLGDRETAKLARDYRKDEEKMQRLLERQLPALVRDVIREEVPAAERKPARRKPSSSRSAASSANGSSASASASTSRAKPAAKRASSSPAKRASASSRSRAKAKS